MPPWWRTFIRILVGDEGLDPPLQFLGGEAIPLPDGAGHQGGVDHVGPRGGDGHREGGLGGLYRALHPPGPQGVDREGLIGGLMVLPAEDGLGDQLPRQGAEEGVVPVEDGQAVGGHGLKDLPLGWRIPSRLPRFSMWASPMLVITATSGGAMWTR